MSKDAASTGNILGLLGPLGESPTHQGRIIQVHAFADLPVACIYWCEIGDKEWAPIPAAIAKAEAWRTEQASLRNTRKVKHHARRKHIEQRAFETGASVEEIEAMEASADLVATTAFAPAK